MAAPPPNFDQLEAMLAVVDAGGFSAAARKLGRAQSAVTYAVRSLEERLGVALFDRSSYRPRLTTEGRALLPRARIICEETHALRRQAEAIVAGAEPELTLVVDAMFPMDLLVEALRLASARFPASAPRVFVETMDAALALVLDGTCAIGLILDAMGAAEPIERQRLIDIEIVPVAAPSHPLGRIAGPVRPEDLRRHAQLVLSEGAGAGDDDHGVLSAQTWRIADLGAKRAMLEAGLGWGGLPRHLIAQDLSSGRLRRVEIVDEAGPRPDARLPMCSAWRRDLPPGPAGREFLARLLELAAAQV